MATIELKDKYRLRSGSRQWVLEKETNSFDKKTGRVIYTPIAFSGSLDSAVRNAYEYFIRKSDADGATELMQESRRLIDELSSILTPKFELKEIK